jgi:hypothetical protein
MHDGLISGRGRSQNKGAGPKEESAPKVANSPRILVLPLRYRGHDRGQLPAPGYARFNVLEPARIRRHAETESRRLIVHLSKA